MLCSGSWLPGLQGQSSRGEYFVYVGTYTGERSKGIYVCRFDADSGRLGAPELAAEVVNPSFLAVHPNGRYVYAASEVSRYEGERSGYVSAFEVKRGTGELKLLNTVSSHGAGPCHLAVDKKGRNVLVANYGGGSVAVLPIKEDGKLGSAFSFIQHSGSSVNQRRQAGPHAHSAVLSPDNRYAFVADLGLDKIMIYRFDSQLSTLTANHPPFVQVKPGSGPRHFVFRPDGKYAYVINEILSTITAFAYDAERGALKEVQTVSTQPAVFTGDNSTAEIQVAGSGRYLYGSNRGLDTIAVFSVNGGNGTLAAVEQVPSGGKTPRNFNIDPTGSFLLAANQNSGNVVVFAINKKSGRLKPTGQSIEVASAVCVEFVRKD